MSEKTFRCRMVTPTEKLVDDAVVYASIPAWDGLMGVLAGRAPFLGRLGLGELRLTFAGSGSSAPGTRSFLVDGGFLKMADNALTIVAERAFPAETISEIDAEAELREAEARQIPADSADTTTASASLRRDRERARLKVKLAKSIRAGGI